MKSIIFIIITFITLIVFGYSIYRIFRYFRFTRPYSLGNWGQRVLKVLKIAIGQTKIFRFPAAGFFHALTFWGFCIILVGSIEMVIDGIAGTERIFASWGWVYDWITALGDVFAGIILIAVVFFVVRRIILRPQRFEGAEMKSKSHWDALIALGLIFILMVTLLGINIFYIVGQEKLNAPVMGNFPLSRLLVPWFANYSPEQVHEAHEVCWWSHILLIYLFANILPYSKHFHVFMSLPNVFLSRLEPLPYIDNMPQITREVKLLLNPDQEIQDQEIEEPEFGIFGVKDVENVTWKQYLDALTCTECGRCTSVCPAHTTGKKLSPRKLMMDVRARMKEKGPGLVKSNQFDDGKYLNKDYITPEEIWACNLCGACAQECPVSIHHPSLIVDLRRYYAMEEGNATPMLNKMFTYIENNGAPWQYSPEDRHEWTRVLDFHVPTMSELAEKGIMPEILFWVGSAGSFDTEAKKTARAFVSILHKFDISFATLGIEETDSGDVARRCGNEMLFQMQALQNIQTLNNYGIKKIVTCDPHDYNTLKNEYPDLGGKYEVYHHTEFLFTLIQSDRVKLPEKVFQNKKVVYHDPCYLGRGNGIYDYPRELIKMTGARLKELKRSRSFSFCCGAGGGQVFKESEKGTKEVYIERTEECIAAQPDIIATACPFCKLMLNDGLKMLDQNHELKTMDIAEFIWQSVKD